MANTKVTGDLIASSTIATGNIADDAVTSDKISGITTAHIAEGSNLYYTNARADARIAAATTSDLTEGTNLYYTDARADARAALLVDSAPSTLNTLNELAAALGDDPNFATTVTNSIATKLPLAGGTLTGDITISSTSPELKFVDTNSFTDTNDRWIVRGGADTLIMRWYDNSASSNTDVLTLSSTAATFAGAVTGTIARFDTLNNNANSANIIYRSGTNTIVGNNASALVVQDGGNVGIGTDSPLNRLFVTAATAGDYAGFIENTNATNGYGLVARTAHTGASAYAFAARAGNSDIFVVRGDGNVGIGVTNPQSKLHINKATQTIGTTIPSGAIVISDTGGGNMVLELGQDRSSISYIQSRNITSNTLYNLALNPSGGNVGIGTTTPQKKVHIEGTGGASEMQILVSSASDTVGHTAGIGLRGEGGEADGDLRIKGGIFFERIAGSFGNGKMILAVNSSASNTSVTVADHALTIDTNKNVGIGTTSPSAKLDARGAIMTGSAAEDGNFSSTTATGMSVCESGSLQITQGWVGSGANGDTVVFRYNATSWKSWGLEWNFMSTNGMSSGFIGGYNNNSTGHSKVINNNAHGITVSYANSSQNNIITFTSTSGFGTHPMASFKYYQSGGDGRPYPSKASITMNS